MPPDLLTQLTSRAVLLPTGVCLIIVGLVMRGLAHSARRAQAYRQQRDRLEGVPVDPAGPDQPDAIDRHLERWLPRYAQVTLWTGLLLTVAGFLR